METADRLSSLIEALENTDTYDRENALIDLYIFLVSQKCDLPQSGNTFAFIELSKWRDCSLRDGVEAYYETTSADELLHLEERMERCSSQEVCRKWIAGSHIYQESGDLTSLDTWIFENEWRINDYLVELTG